MIFQRVYSKIISRNIRKYSTKIRPKVEVNPTIQHDIETGAYKPRKHPGIFKPRTINVPPEFVTAAEKALSDYPVKQLITDGAALNNYLLARHPPVEHNAVVKKKREIESRVLSAKANVDELNDDELQELRDRMKSKINFVLKSKIYAWKPIEFDMYNCLRYMLSRSAAEYAALMRIFQEINVRHKDFKPKSFFDFGSGVGTALWAARQFWGRTIFEYFCVDSSVHMNDLAMIMLKGGTGLGQGNLKGVFYRQFLPATNTSYDVVVSAYSLMELPSAQSRLETILKLWNKTQNYLVIVELGTNAGFKIVNEARDFILQIRDEKNSGHVFSPCPHDSVCPRFLMDTTPCNFPISYMTLPIGQNSELRTEKFCYVVLKKGAKADSESWPRVVRPTLARSRHAVCRMCMPSGKLEEIVFSAAKHGRVAYRCAKVTEWGDLVPIAVDGVPEN